MLCYMRWPALPPLILYCSTTTPSLPTCIPYTITGMLVHVFVDGRRLLSPRPWCRDCHWSMFLVLYSIYWRIELIIALSQLINFSSQFHCNSTSSYNHIPHCDAVLFLLPYLKSKAFLQEQPVSPPSLVFTRIVVYPSAISY